MRRDTAAGEPIRGHIRQVGFRRVAHGLFLPVNDGADAGIEFLRDLRAWLLVLPAGAAFTHLTAARLLGWQLPPHIPEHVPVFAAVSQSDPRPRRPGLICSRLLRSQSPSMVAGVPVERPEEVLLRAARDLGLLDLTILVDSARHLGHIDERGIRVGSPLDAARRSQSAARVGDVVRACAVGRRDDPAALRYHHGGPSPAAGGAVRRCRGMSWDWPICSWSGPGSCMSTTGSTIVHVASTARTSGVTVGSAGPTTSVEDSRWTTWRITRQPSCTRSTATSGEPTADRGSSTGDDSWTIRSCQTVAGAKMMHRWQQQMGVTDWSGTA